MFSAENFPIGLPWHLVHAGASGFSGGERFSSLWGRLQTGFVRTYALTILLGVVTVLGYITYLALR